MHTSSPTVSNDPQPSARRDTLAVVLPCYRVKEKILCVVEPLLEVADFVIVVDDCCPEQSGAHLRQCLTHPKLTILFHEQNKGVGGAMVTGFEEALRLEADIVIKMDSDGQMDPKHIPRLTAPLRNGKADFAKGNRFFDLHALQSMPTVRRIGNLGLTLLTKAASGYWNISDPTNGFLAIRKDALSLVNFHLLDPRYFFEISLLVQLNVIRALAVDVAIPARYADEKSSLNPFKILCTFPSRLLTGFLHRLWWRYFIFDINIVTIFLVTGSFLFFGGALFGAWRWGHSGIHQVNQSAGTVALAMLPMILGFQMLLQAIVLDTLMQPHRPISDSPEAK